MMPARAPKPPAEKTEDKRRLILDAARRLLIRRGFPNMALDEIAREAGVAKGTLYLYFRDKEDLFAAAFEELVARLGEGLTALSGSGKQGRLLLESTVSLILEHFERNRDFISQLGSSHLPGCGGKSGVRLLGKFRANVEQVGAILARCGLPRAAAKDLPFESFALFSLCRGAFIRKCMTGSEQPLPAQASRIVDFFLHGAGGSR